jgi:hypothetical protein
MENLAVESAQDEFHGHLCVSSMSACWLEPRWSTLDNAFNIKNWSESIDKFPQAVSVWILNSSV